MEREQGCFYYAWEPYTFLPLFKLPTTQDLPRTFCEECPLAPYEHPLEQSVEDEHSYHLLCTAIVLKNGLLKPEVVLATEAGCGCREITKAELKKFVDEYEKIFTNHRRKSYG